MKAMKLKLSDIRYNPERAGFEALVTVHDAGRAMRYPAFAPAPVHAEYDLIARRLTARAMEAHRKGRYAQRSFLKPVVALRPRLKQASPQDLPPLAA